MFLFITCFGFSQVQMVGIVDQDPLLKVELNPKSIYEHATKNKGGILNLPFEAIGVSGFSYKHDKMLSAEFAAKMPNIKTYYITSVDNPNIKGRLLITPQSTWATLLTPNGIVSLYPKDGDFYIEQGVNRQHSTATCTNFEQEGQNDSWIKAFNDFKTNKIKFSNGTHKRTYDMAIVCTGEFYENNGANNNAVLTLIAATVNSLNVIYENELAVKLRLLTPFLYTNSTTDIFIPDNMGGDIRTNQAGVAVDMHFNLSDYDIGHVFHNSVNTDDGWSSGGVARLAAVCKNSVSSGSPAKAKGWSGTYNTSGNGWISLSAHEIGHMFGATHTFNGEGSSCDDAISQTSAYEIGSGTTIMSYQGICDDAQNIDGGGATDNYFHVHSLSQMVAYVNNQATCSTIVPLNNTPPVVNANQCNDDIRIPKTTAFYLRGNAGDQENENITYTWEQYDEDGDNNTSTQGMIGIAAGNSSVAPLFRSFAPSSSSERYFPTLSTIAQGLSSDPFQVVSRKSRILHFQLTARDNNASGGGVDSDELTVNVSNNGPLTIQNISSVSAGQEFSVNWSTNGSEEFCTSAKILLSIDGGLSYPILIQDGIDFASGTASVTLSPSFPNSEMARLMIACDDSDCYTFFDITNNDFTISSDCQAAPNIVCDTDFEIFDQGDPGLDLELTGYIGEVTNSHTETIINDITTRLDIAIIGENGVGCNNLFSYFAKKKTFVVDKTGIYSFLIDVGANGGTGIFSIYNAANYNESNPCPSFITSNTQSVGGTSFSLSGSVTVQLNACQEYIIVYTNNTSIADLPIDTEITSISGPGDFLIIDENTSNDYATIFIAVNDLGIVEIVSATSDFTALSGGLYDIYNVSYKSAGPEPPANVDPLTWVGKTIPELQATDCVILSSNKKQVDVEFTCRITDIVAGVQSICDPLTNIYSQELIITYEQGPTSGNLIVNGIPFPITASPQTITLLGQTSDGVDKDVNASFSAIPGCAKFVQDLYVAPDNCCPITFDLGGDREVCDSEEIILDGGSDGIEYHWFNNGTPLDNTESTLEVTESGNYFLEVVNDSGCSKNEVVNIKVNSSPTMSLGDDVAGCDGESLSLIAISNASVFEWSVNGTILVDDTIAILAVDDPGTYIATGTNSDNCMTSDTVIVDFYPVPIVELGDAQVFCEGDDPYTLNAGAGSDAYTWLKNGIIIPLEENNELVVTESGVYTVLALNGGECEVSDQVEIIYNELPEILAGDDRNVCEGLTTNLLAFINADNFEWTYNGLPIADQSDNPEVSEEGMYILTGTNDSGCKRSDTVLVTIVMPPMIDLGDDKIGCIGSEVPLSVDSVGFVGWTFNNSLISNNASINAIDAGQYVVKVIAASGCTGTDTINIDFSPGPSLELGDDQKLCQGDSYTIVANTTGDNISWYLDGIELTSETEFEIEVTASGMYSAIVSGGSGCEVEDEVEVIVNELPIVDLGNDKAICDGESVDIESGIDNVTYLWTYEGVFFSEEENITAIESGTYNLVVTNTNNCTATDEILINANNSPTIMLNDNYGICEGESATIIAEGNGDNFIWVVNGVELSENGNTIVVDEDASVLVTVFSVDDCMATDNTTVTAASSPTADIGDDITLCPDDEVTLATGSQDEYLWSSGDTTATVTIVSTMPDMMSTETYSVTVTNNAGCTDKDEVEITLLPIINGTISTSAAGVCNGEPVELTAFGGVTYEWLDPNGTLSGISNEKAIAAPTETTTYQVIVTDDCPNNEDIVSIEIEVFEASEGLSAGEDDCVVEGQSYELQAEGGASYQWRENESFATALNISNPTVEPVFETTYIVDITDSNGCVYADSVTICLTDDPLAEFKLINIITPNDDGDNDVLIFQGLEAFPDNLLTIYNRWGYPVFERRRYQTEFSQLWNGENGGDILPADTYYYILEFDNKVYKSSITILR